MEKKLLQVKDLGIGFYEKDKFNKVVDEISFELYEGEILGIVGESGSGKTITSLCIAGLLSKDAQIQSGSILFEGNDLLTMSEKELRRRKGEELSIIFQEPMTSLNPVLRVGDQVEEMLKLHTKLNKMDRKTRTLHMLEEVGLNDSEIIYNKYPHQLSGGMRQRVMIAMAMICNPKLLIADEPTTALDVTVQAQILELIRNLNKEFSTTIILVSHDLGVIKGICDRMLVMNEGKIVESGKTEDIFLSPKEEYTKKLINAVPTIEFYANKSKVKTTNNETTNNETTNTEITNTEITNIETTNTKTKNTETKNTETTNIETINTKKINTHSFNKIELISAKEKTQTKEKTQAKEKTQTKEKTQAKEKTQTKEKTKNEEKTNTKEIILQVKNLSVSYDQKQKKLISKTQKKEEVHGVSFSLHAGEILGIVGESGSGKTSLAKGIVGLIKDIKGEIICKEKRPQMVFQDPYGSLNPAKKIGWILEEPLKVQGKYTKKERKEKVVQMLMEVGLQENFTDRYVSELSGGQRQRVSIACALITNSKLIVLDEPVSALDVTVQAQVLELLLKLRTEYDLSYLFISHDLNVIYQMCDRVLVMYEGEIVEEANIIDLFYHPKHEYSKLLLRSISEI